MDFPVTNTEVQEFPLPQTSTDQQDDTTLDAVTVLLTTVIQYISVDLDSDSGLDWEFLDT